MQMSQNTILITGGTSGIGFELARQLTELGNTVIVTGRNQAKLEDAKKKIPKLQTFTSDVSDPKSIASLYASVTKTFPNLNMVINNAGIMREINLHDKEPNLEALTEEIEINLCGTIRMCRQFLPHLKAQPNAALVNVSSGLAFVPLPISPVYCATKAAIHSFTQSLRVQVKKTKVKVFELAPPATKTEMLGTMTEEDLKGVAVMGVQEMVAAAIKGFSSDSYEIRPGQANQLKFMSRLAPEFILAQLSKPVERMLSSTKH